MAADATITVPALAAAANPRSVALQLKPVYERQEVLLSPQCKGKPVPLVSLTVRKKPCLDDIQLNYDALYLIIVATGGYTPKVHYLARIILHLNQLLNG